jgi:hypothetical protein
MVQWSIVPWPVDERMDAGRLLGIPIHSDTNSRLMIADDWIRG